MKKTSPSIFHVLFARSIGVESDDVNGRGMSQRTLPAAIRATRFTFDGVSCYVAGEGPPMLLVHSVNAAPSAAEVSPIFDHYTATHTVFAIDLPGYGLSDRTDRPYTPRVMTDALHGVAEHIRMRCGDAPIDAVALSLGCEFLARAAMEQPARWGRLALVSPTGLDGRTARRAPREGTRYMAALHAFLTVPLWANALFRGLTRPSVIRYFLQRTWGSKDIDEASWAYAVKTARQPGARFAPFHFISGGLFSTDTLRVYTSLQQPVWMSHGTRGDFTDYRGKSVVEGRDNWSFTVFDTGALPYFEKPDEFFSAFDNFLASRGEATPLNSAKAAAEAVAKASAQPENPRETFNRENPGDAVRSSSADRLGSVTRAD